MGPVWFVSDSFVVDLLTELSDLIFIDSGPEPEIEEMEFREMFPTFPLSDPLTYLNFWVDF